MRFVEGLCPPLLPDRAEAALPFLQAGALLGSHARTSDGQERSAPLPARAPEVRIGDWTSDVWNDRGRANEWRSSAPAHRPLAHVPTPSLSVLLTYVTERGMTVPGGTDTMGGIGPVTKTFPSGHWRI